MTTLLSKSNCCSDRAIIAQLFQVDASSLTYPLVSTKVPAGFPSPADDYIETNLKLDDILIKHPAATYFIRVSGNSMIGEGIHDQDLLIVDRSLPPLDGKIVIAAIFGEITVKKLKLKEGKMFLIPGNPDYPAIEIKEGQDIFIWGVVKTIIHEV